MSAPESMGDDNSKAVPLTAGVRMAELALVAIVYGLLLRFGLLMSIPPGVVTPIWPASGFAFAVVFVRGYRVWPGVVMGVVVGNTMWGMIDPASIASWAGVVSAMVAIGFGNATEAVVGVWVVRRLCREGSPFLSTAGVAVFLLATAVCCLVASTVGALVLVIMKLVTWEGFGISWTTWYLGDAIGVILVAPALIELSRLVVRPTSLSGASAAEIALTFVVALGVSTWVFNGWWLGVETARPFLYLLIPVVLWSAVRTPLLSSSLVVLSIAGVAIWSTISGYGPFQRESLNTSLMLLQLFMGVIMTTTLVMSASASQQRLADQRAVKYSAELMQINGRLRREVKDRTAVESELKTIVTSAPDAILTVSADGVILTSNVSAGGIFHCEPPKLIGKPIERFLVGCGNLREELLNSQVSLSRTTLARRMDGSIFPADYTAAAAAQGAVTVVLVRDITERTELEGSVLRAGEEEKERIARDLHDGLGSLLGGIDCLTKSLELQLDAEAHDASGKVKAIGTAIKDSIRMTRRLSHGLYAVGGDPGALQEALRDFAKATDAGGVVSCRFECPEAFEIHDRVFANHLFRIAQEAVTNAIRHSGTESITIVLERRKDRVRLSVCDNGRGMSPVETVVGPRAAGNGAGEPRTEEDGERPSSGLGLRTMAYRAHAAHGELAVSSEPGGGTTVLCDAPLPQRSAPPPEGVVSERRASAADRRD